MADIGGYLRMKSNPIIIIGMHRSGTSIVARITSRVGIDIGKDLDIHDENRLFKNINRQLLYKYGAHWANPDPFLEQINSNSFVTTNTMFVSEKLLEDANFQKQGEGIQYWGWKDPRNTLTLPVWLNLFPNAKVIHVIRNGFDVALSLSRRETKRLKILLLKQESSEKLMWPTTLRYGYGLWAKYVELGFRYEEKYTDNNFFTLFYEDLISNPRIEILKLIDFLEVDVEKTLLDELAERTLRLPTQRTWIDTIRLKILLFSGGINKELLSKLGYSMDSLQRIHKS